MPGAAIQDRVFKLTGGHPALDLVNTLDWRFRQGRKDELMESYGDLLAFAEQSQLLTVEQVRGLGRTVSATARHRVLNETRELREALAEVFYAKLDGHSPGSAQIGTLERFFKELRGRQRMVWSELGLRWELADAENSARLPLWLLVRAASDLVLSDHLEMLRACGDPE